MARDLAIEKDEKNIEGLQLVLTKNGSRLYELVNFLGEWKGGSSLEKYRMLEDRVERARCFKEIQKE